MDTLLSMTDVIGELAAEAGGGRPLPDAVRQDMEPTFGTSLVAVRVHDGPEADLITRALGADAVTCGQSVFFRAGAYQPDTEAGRWLIAHEIAHAVRHGGGMAGTRWSLSAPGDLCEADADRCADLVLRGARVHGDAEPGAGPSRRLMRHVSYEHRLLGDGPTKDLVAVAAKQGGEFLKKQIELVGLWIHNPRDVSEAAVEAAFPGTKTFRIGPGRVLVTYGELNALPDYLPDAVACESLTADQLVPILQTIRQEGYNALNGLNGRTTRQPFDEALTSPDSPEPLYTLWEVAGFDSFSYGWGAEGKDHYGGILARNACHFAPHAWYRWKTYHHIARRLAQQWYAQGKKNPDFERLAWRYHGYADHFLQDAFAAGHLINRPLVMQWFVEWAQRSDLDIADLGLLKDMVAGLQPFLAGQWLYDTRALYDRELQRANDPQTAQETGSVVARYLTSTLASKPGKSDFETYQSYLAFVTSTAAGLASNDLHDYYNSESLWVASDARREPYRVWGDFTLLSGAGGTAGVDATSMTAQLSQQSLKDILATGSTPVTMEQIAANFPTKAGGSADDVQGLREWAETRRWVAETRFSKIIPTLQRFVAARTLSPTLGVVSVDQRLARVWSSELSGTGATSEAQVLTWQGRVFASASGLVVELDPVSGAVVQKKWFSSTVASDPTRLATDGRNLYVGFASRVYALRLDDLGAGPWPAPVLVGPEIPPRIATVMVSEGRLYAGCWGKVWRIDTASGQVTGKCDAGVGPGEVRLSADGWRLYAGFPETVAAIALDDWKRPAWARPSGNMNANACTDVLRFGGYLYAGVAGKVVELHTDSGIPNRGPLTLTTDEPPLTVQAPTRLAADGERLYAGYNGSVYSVSLTDFTRQWALYITAPGGNPHVEVLRSGDRLYAGYQGHVVAVGPDNGHVHESLRVTYDNPFGMSLRTSLSYDGQHLYAGVNGYAYKMLAPDSWMAGTVAHDWWDWKKWHGWESGFRHAPPMQDITAVALQHVEVFGIGKDGNVYHNWLDSKDWHGWEGGFRHAPPMRSVALVRGYPDAWAMGIGRDGRLYWLSWKGTWEDRWSLDSSGYLRQVRQVAGAAWGDEVWFFAVTPDGGLHGRSFNSRHQDWSAWQPLIPGPEKPLDSVIPVASRDRLELFAIGTDGTLLRSRYSPAEYEPWTPWEQPFNALPPVRAMSAALGAAHVEAFALGTDGTVYHNWYDKAWHDWVPGFRGAPLSQSVYAVQKAVSVEVFLLGLDGTLYRNAYGDNWGKWEKNFDGAQQQVLTVTAAQGANFEVFAVMSGWVR